MNAIRQTQQLNKRELENATAPSASWHADYRDTAWIYVGGLPLDLTEGDVVTIFSQFGSPTHLNLIRDRETGKSKGFGFLKYEDQRSCDLAVDNLTGADVLGRLLRVDHTRYKKRDDEDEDTYRIDRLEAEAEAELNGKNGKRASDTEESDDERRRKKRWKPMLKAEKELEQLLAIKERGEEDEDPMTGYLIRQKREEVANAGYRAKERERRHRHHHRHRDRDEKREDRHSRRRDDNEEDATKESRRSEDKSHRRHGKDRHQEDSSGRDRKRDKPRRRDGSPRSSSPDARSRDREPNERQSGRSYRSSRREEDSPPRRQRSRSRSQEHRSSRRRYSSEDERKRRPSSRVREIRRRQGDEDD